MEKVLKIHLAEQRSGLLSMARNHIIVSRVFGGALQMDIRSEIVSRCFHVCPTIPSFKLRRSMHRGRIGKTGYILACSTTLALDHSSSNIG